MLGASTLATALSGKGGVADVAAFALNAGLSIVLDKPGTKVPMCILGPRAVNAADREAITLAATEGKSRADRARHACGIAHALTGREDAKHVRVLIARLEKRWGERINLGIEPGRSRLLVVDVDTAAEDASFHRWLAAHAAVGPQMTVRSPGKRAEHPGPDGTAEWVHRDGGHYWFELPPGVTLPINGDTGVLKLGDGAGFAVVWANRQVLIPPSVREEGAYVFTGAPVTVAPAALIEAIQNEVIRRTALSEQRLAQRLESEPTSIDLWDAQTSWADVLLPDGWVQTGKADNCGCPVWTAPGPHDNPKSATAHELACMRWDTADGWGPLHIWTDTPPEELAGKRNWTKLQFLAAMAGEALGDMARDLGLIERPDEVDWTPDGADAPLPSTSPPTSPVPQPDTDLFEEPGSADNTVETPAETTAPELSAAETLLARAKSSAQLRAEPPLAPLIDGLLDKDATFRIVGPSGVGKTFVTLDLAACLATGQPWHGHETHADGRPVVYVVAEGAAGFKRRLWAWEQENNDGVPIPEDRLYVFDFATQLSDKDRWKVFRQAMQLINPAFVVLDTQARVTVGMEENSATDMGIAVARLDLIRQENPGCAVGTVHHTGYNGEHGRGSTSVYGAVNCEISIQPGPARDDGRKSISIENPKQKDDVEQAPILVSLRQVDIPDDLDRPAAVVDHGDPFADPQRLVEPNAELNRVPDGAGVYVLLASLIRDTLDGPEEGWTEAAARQLLSGRQRNGRDIDGPAKRQAWSRLRTGNVTGRRAGPPWIEPMEEGKTGRWRLTDAGRALLAEALNDDQQNV
jgi:hypothetical protein